MTSMSEHAARQATESAPLRLLGRVGLAAYGAVHLLVAWLAIQVAIGDGGKADKTGALQTVAATPVGAFLLWVITVGLLAFVVWQVAEAIWGYQYAGEHRTRKRLISAGEALLFGYLAYTAGRIAANASAPSDSDQSSMVAKLLAEPYGKALVALGGLVVIALAAFVVRHGVKKRFLEDLDLGSANPSIRRTVTRLGQVGYTALGVAYGIAGALVVVAALRSDPSKATGLDTALKTLAAQPYGDLLLVVVALGVAAFGVYCLFDARYRRYSAAEQRVAHASQ
jgi:Domain of Unknown Function (DUF1206)